MASFEEDEDDDLPAFPIMNFRHKGWARKLERGCCMAISYFPLTFVYGLTTWAVYVEVKVSFWRATTFSSYFTALLGVVLYCLANISYTIAVFTTPGSPLEPRQDWRNRGASSRPSAYSALPTYDDHHEPTSHDPHDSITTLTAKASTGKPRHCKKCQVTKPDRAHHCSACGRCVLKMDHHCPWLATCVGLHNYKPFLLFLIYTSLFCWLCFGTSGWWVWTSIGEAQRAEDGIKIVNAILLAVLGGIIGLVLSGFTIWHLYLAASGQTTIESLEKTRYLSPLKKSMEQQLQNQAQRHYLGQEEDGQVGDGEQEQTLLEHLKETHANALPGILRPEEGEEDSRSHTPQSLQPPSHTRQLSSSPAQDSLQRTYASLEAQRERERYAAYLDEKDSEKLPNAFDLGWKRNLLHVFGNRPWFWWLPICNTSGDGWVWEVSSTWTEASAEVAREREERAREEAAWNVDTNQRAFQPPVARKDFRWTPGQGFVDRAGDGSPNGPDGRHMQMQPLDRRKPAALGPPRAGGQGLDSGSGDDYDTSSDEDLQGTRGSRPIQHPQLDGTKDWNDIPDDFLTPGRSKSATETRSRSRGRRKGD